MSNTTLFALCLQAVVAISDIPKDVPIHLELASMTDKEYMNSIMQEVYDDTKSCVQHIEIKPKNISFALITGLSVRYPL